MTFKTQIDKKERGGTDLSGYVPYIDATADLDLGIYDFITTGTVTANGFYSYDPINTEITHMVLGRSVNEAFKVKFNDNTVTLLHANDTDEDGVHYFYLDIDTISTGADVWEFRSNGNSRMILNSSTGLWLQGALQLANYTSNGFIKTSAGNGTLSIDTNTYLIDAPSDGTTYGRKDGAWSAVTVSQTKTITFNIGDGVNSITAGTVCFIKIPFACTWSRWDIAEVSSTPITGSIVLDVRKDTTGNYPPTSGDTIAGTDKPTLSSQTNNSLTSLTTATTNINANDFISVYVESVSACRKIVLQLGVTL